MGLVRSEVSPGRIYAACLPADVAPHEVAERLTIRFHHRDRHSRLKALGPIVTRCRNETRTIATAYSETKSFLPALASVTIASRSEIAQTTLEDRFRRSD